MVVITNKLLKACCIKRSPRKVIHKINVLLTKLKLLSIIQENYQMGLNLTRPLPGMNRSNLMQDLDQLLKVGIKVFLLCALVKNASYWSIRISVMVHPGQVAFQQWQCCLLMLNCLIITKRIMSIQLNQLINLMLLKFVVIKVKPYSNRSHIKKLPKSTKRQLSLSNSLLMLNLVKRLNL